MHFRQAELRKGSWALETWPLSLTPRPHPSLCKLDSGCQRAQGKCSRSTEDTWDKEPQFLRARLWSSMLCWLTWCHVKGGKDRWVTQKACDRLRSHAYPGLGLFPPDQLLAGCFALCLLSVSLLDHFAETKALHLTYNQVIVRFLSLPLMTMLQQLMILRSSCFHQF